MYLFDTYALIEILKGNNNYSKYKGKKIILNNFILTELVYYFAKANDYKNMTKYIDYFSNFVVEIDNEIIKFAMIFRYKNKKKKLSMVDCISYVQAKVLGVRFLTGDKEFEGFENVEFVK